MAIVAVAGVCMFSAFKANEHNQVRTEQWFEYDGSGNPTLAENYVLSGSTSPGCSGDQKVCAIQAMDNGSDQPVITTALAAEINTAINNQEPSAHVNLRN